MRGLVARGRSAAELRARLEAAARIGDDEALARLIAEVTLTHPAAVRAGLLAAGAAHAAAQLPAGAGLASA